MAICAAGPPKAVKPKTVNRRVNSISRARVYAGWPVSMGCLGSGPTFEYSMMVSQR